MKDSGKEKKSIVIKRYQNRKLYDTVHSTYVTLEDIGAIIRRGDDVQVVDNKTKEDLTSVTLTQIIFEEEKKKKNPISLGLLKRIIMGSGETLKDFVSKTTESVQTTLHTVRDGAADEPLIKGVLSKTQNLSRNLEDKIKATVGSITHVVSLQTEVRKLRQRIHFLEKKLKVYETK